MIIVLAACCRYYTYDYRAWTCGRIQGGYLSTSNSSGRCHSLSVYSPMMFITSPHAYFTSIEGLHFFPLYILLPCTIYRWSCGPGNAYATFPWWYLCIVHLGSWFMLAEVDEVSNRLNWRFQTSIQILRHWKCWRWTNLINHIGSNIQHYKLHSPVLAHTVSHLNGSQYHPMRKEWLMDRRLSWLSCKNSSLLEICVRFSWCLMMIPRGPYSCYRLVWACLHGVMFSWSDGQT